MKWVVDASVAVKWLVPEPETPEANALLPQELLVPDTLYSECSNVLWKKVVRKQVSAAEVQLGAQLLLEVEVQVFNTKPLLEPALQLAIALNHPAYDCFYLALAQQESAVLVTADKRLFNRCQQADADWLKPCIRLLGAHEQP